MEEIHKLHARLMISVWPNMDPRAVDNKEMKQHGCLLGNGTTYNAFQPQGREIYWRQTNSGLFSHGIDAWWCDCTEPFEADWKGDFKPEPEERMRINTHESKRYIDPEFINAYSLLHSQGIYEGQRQTTDRKRVVNLTRSAYPGQHRYGTITWSGDISSLMGYSPPSNRRWVELLYNRVSLLDSRYWRILRKKQTGIVVLERRL